MEFFDKLIQLRKERNWSQEDLAEKLNVSRQAISRWENGTAYPDAQNILQISKSFNITTDYLLNDDYEKDEDIPVVKTVIKEKESLITKKRNLHLVAAICFTISVFSSIIAAVYSTTDLQLTISCFVLTICAANAVAQFILFFRKS